MKRHIGVLIFFLSLGAHAQTASKGKQISGTVRIIRSMPQTEVFFKDLKDSVIIPSGSLHNQIYSACETSMKKGTAVQLVVDPVSRRVLSLPSAVDSSTTKIEKSPGTSETSTIPAAK